MKNLLKYLWKNKAAVITAVQIAWEYAPKVCGYVKEKIDKMKKKQQ